MDPITAATAFATTVGLLADFVARREAGKNSSYEEFVSWLAEQRHEEIRVLLEQNTSTTIGIKALLGATNEEVLSRLERLDRSLAGFAASFHAYRGLAEAIRPEAAISEQALSLLTQLYRSGASKFISVSYLDGSRTLAIVDGPAHELTYTDARFLDDDLKTLVELGLLGESKNGRGEPLYSFRRAAAHLIEKSLQANQ